MGIGMRLHVATPVQIVTSFLIAACILVCALLVGLYGPQLYEFTTFSAYNCSSGQHYWNNETCFGVQLFEGQVWEKVLPPIDKYNKYLELLFVPYLLTPPNSSVLVQFKLQKEIYGWSSKEGGWELKSNISFDFEFINCDPQHSKCESLNILYTTDIRPELIRLYVVEWDHGLHFGDVDLQFVQNSEEFSKLDLILRSVFLLISLITLASYWYVMRHYKWKEWDKKQKWLVMMLVALVVFNNPLFGFQFIANVWVFQVGDFLFTISFLLAFITIFGMDESEWGWRMIFCLVYLSLGSFFSISVASAMIVHPYSHIITFISTLIIMHGEYTYLLWGPIFVVLSTRNIAYPGNLTIPILLVWGSSSIILSVFAQINSHLFNGVVVVFFLTLYNVVIWLMACAIFPVPSYQPPPAESDLLLSQHHAPL